MLIVVVIRSITLPGAMEGIKWYLNVTFQNNSSDISLLHLVNVSFQ